MTTALGSLGGPDLRTLSPFMSAAADLSNTHDLLRRAHQGDDIAAMVAAGDLPPGSVVERRFPNHPGHFVKPVRSPDMVLEKQAQGVPPIPGVPEPPVPETSDFVEKHPPDRKSPSQILKDFDNFMSEFGVGIADVIDANMAPDINPPTIKQIQVPNFAGPSQLPLATASGISSVLRGVGGDFRLPFIFGTR